MRCRVYLTFVLFYYTITCDICGLPKLFRTTFVYTNKRCFGANFDGIYRPQYKLRWPIPAVKIYFLWQRSIFCRCQLSIVRYSYFFLNYSFYFRNLSKQMPLFSFLYFFLEIYFVIVKVSVVKFYLSSILFDFLKCKEFREICKPNLTIETGQSKKCDNEK